MRTRVTMLVCLLSFVVGCDVIFPDFEKFVPDGDISALVIRTKYISHTSTEIVYETELQFMEKYFNQDNSQVIKSDFVVDANTTILQVDEMNYYGSSKTDVIFLIDQSTSYEVSDPHNARSQLINKFAQVFEGPNFSIGAFAEDGELDGPLEFVTGEEDPDQFVKSIFDLAKRTGGNCNLYDAVDVAIDLFPAGTSREKQIVVLVQNNDNASNTTLQSVIAKAKLQQVRVHIVSLGNSVSHNAMARLSQETGGFYSACETDKQMIQTLDNLNRNITGYSSGVKVRVRMIPPGPIMSGMQFLHSLVVEDYYYNYNYNPVYPFITIP